MKCPYCKQEAKWVENKEIYGRNYGKSYMMYYCKPCDAYIGCDKLTGKAFGTMANKELRGWRRKVHAYIDPLWKDGLIERNDLYKRIAYLMNRYTFHVGSSTIEDCKKVLNMNKKALLRKEDD
jgi:hypothetical protein